MLGKPGKLLEFHSSKILRTPRKSEEGIKSKIKKHEECNLDFGLKYPSTTDANNCRWFEIKICEKLAWINGRMIGFDILFINIINKLYELASKVSFNI